MEKSTENPILKVHAVKVYKFKPKPINCMGYNYEKDCLALCRSDSAIEIWNTKQCMFKETELIGLHHEEIKALAWCKNRLFSAGLDGFINEYDIDCKVIKKKVAVTGGPVWCLEASKDSLYLAAGTENGTVCIFNVTEDDIIYHTSHNARNERVLSIGWHPHLDTIVTGSMDYVNMWSLSSKKTLEFKVGRKLPDYPTAIWCIALLEDMTVVIGDSRGCVCFFSGENGTLIQLVKTHTADILAMCLVNEQSIWASGIHPVIFKIECVEKPTGKYWVKTASRRHHTHDVTSLIYANNNLFSGGADTHLFKTTFPLHVEKCIATPPKGYISAAGRSNEILLSYPNFMELWRVGVEGSRKGRTCLGTYSENPVKIGLIHMKPSAVLHLCSISPEAEFILYVSSIELIKCLRIVYPRDGGVRIDKIKQIPDNLLLPITDVKWLNNNTALAVSACGSIQVLEVQTEKIVLLDSWKVSENAIKLFTMSEDSRFIAFSDYKNRIKFYNITTKKIGTLPKTVFPPMCINANFKHILAVDSGLNLIEFDITKNCFTQFHRDHLYSNADKLVGRKCALHMCTYNKDPKSLLMVDYTSIIHLPKTGKIDSVRKTDQRKRKFQKVEDLENIGSLGLYENDNHILWVDCLKDFGFVWVEQNVDEFESTLPQALKKNSFGL